MSRLIFVNRYFYPDYSATSQILSDLAFHLAARGKAISVITSRGLYDDPRADLPSLEEVKGVTVHRVCKPRFGRASLAGRAVDNAAMYYGFARAALALARTGDCLIVKTDPPLLSIPLARVARLRGTSLINWLQDLYPEVALRLGMRSLKPFAPLLVEARNASLRSAAANVVIGVGMARRLAEHRIAATRITIIANWCDDDSIAPQPVHAGHLRSDWGLEGKFVIGYSGNLGRAHEYATVLGAAEHLREEQDIVFLCVGGGHHMSALKAEVARRKLSMMFQFRPYQNVDLLRYALSVADLHWLSLLPEMEGLIMPSKLYGIAAAGRPILAIVDTGGEIAELVRSFCCGVAVAPGESRQLAAILRTLRNDPARCAQMGFNARAMLEALFRRRYAFERWEKLIDDVALSQAQMQHAQL